MDSILSLGVTSLVTRLIASGREGPDDPVAVDLRRAARMSALLRRDLLLLAAYYDQSG
jgi:hypothetical protein